MRGRLIWTAWLALMAATGAIGAQNGSNGLSTKQQNMAKDVDPDWEVITIKPNNTDNRKDRIDVEGRHVVAMNETVEAMMVTGFNMQKNQVAGLPDWARTEHWDVDGVPNVEGQPDLQQLQSMMRKMLEKRFDLKLHHEQREMPVFGHPIRNVRVANGQLANTFTTRLCRTSLRCCCFLQTGQLWTEPDLRAGMTSSCNGRWMKCRQRRQMRRPDCLRRCRSRLG